MKYKLIMNGLDCANCAGKIEKEIANTEGFSEVSLVFATKSLYFQHIEDDNIIEKVQKITDSIEDGVTVSREVKKSKNHSHNHDECNDCDHGENSKLSKILLFIAVAFAVIALLLDIFKINEIAVAILSAVSIVLSGYKVCIS
ncbi:MAG: cation transporter, partial [Ruminococcus sp.]|nr:cation transporter [Ruminococcus sp.]